MLKIYHLKCSLTEQFLLITFLTVAVAATQSCARKTKTIALVPATAFSLAATLRKLLATLSNWRKYCPKNLSHVILLLPTPVRRAVGHSIWHIVAWPHMQPAWYATRFICWSRAACVGGLSHMTSVFGQTVSVLLHQYYQWHVMSCIVTTNFSRLLWSSSQITGGY